MTSINYKQSYTLCTVNIELINVFPRKIYMRKSPSVREFCLIVNHQYCIRFYSFFLGSGNFINVKRFLSNCKLSSIFEPC